MQSALWMAWHVSCGICSTKVLVRIYVVLWCIQAWKGGMPWERPCRHILQAKDGRGVYTRVGRILGVARMLTWMAMTVVVSVIHRSYRGCLPVY